MKNGLLNIVVLLLVVAIGVFFIKALKNDPNTKAQNHHFCVEVYGLDENCK